MRKGRKSEQEMEEEDRKEHERKTAHLKGGFGDYADELV